MRLYAQLRLAFLAWGRFLVQRFDISNDGFHLRESSEVSYYASAAYWAVVKGRLDVEDFSCFFSILKSLLNLVKAGKTRVEVILALNKLLVYFTTPIQSDFMSSVHASFHSGSTVALKRVVSKAKFASLSRPRETESSVAALPGRKEVNPDLTSAAKLISDYLYSTLLTHYRLYECVFSKDQIVAGLQPSVLVETPLLEKRSFVIPPLEDGLAETPPAMARTAPWEVTEVTEVTPEEASETGEELFRVDNSAISAIADHCAELDPQTIREVIEEVADELLGDQKRETADRLMSFSSRMICAIESMSSNSLKRSKR